MNSLEGGLINTYAFLYYDSSWYYQEHDSRSEKSVRRIHITVLCLKKTSPKSPWIQPEITKPHFHELPPFYRLESGCFYTFCEHTCCRPCLKISTSSNQYSRNQLQNVIALIIWHSWLVSIGKRLNLFAINTNDNDYGAELLNFCLLIYS